MASSGRVILRCFLACILDGDRSGTSRIEQAHHAPDAYFIADLKSPLGRHVALLSVTSQAVQPGCVLVHDAARKTVPFAPNETRFA